MDTGMIITLVILVFTAAFLVWGKIRSDIVAISSMLALILSGVVTVEQGISGFSNPMVIMIAGLFIVGGAITQTGIASKVSNQILSFAGRDERRLFVMISLVTILVGLFVSNTGTVAILLPIVVSIAQHAGLTPSRLLMPMAFMASISGLMTLIGTPPTLIVHEALIEAGHEGLQFFTPLPLGLILLVAGLFLLWPLTKLLEKKGKNYKEGANVSKSPEQLTSHYEVVNNLYRVLVSQGAPIIGQKLFALDMTNKYACSVTEIRIRPTIRTLGTPSHQQFPDANTEIVANSVLYVIGEYKNVLNFVEENKLTFLDSNEKVEVEKPKFAGKFRFSDIGLSEVLLLDTSRLIGRLVKESELRSNYEINVISIQRNNHFIIQDLKDQQLQSGDMLLVQGAWENISRLSRLEPDIVVLGQPEVEASRATIDTKGPFATIVITLMVLAMVLNWLPPVTAVLIAAILVILGGCFRTVKDAYRTINVESIILFATMMPLAVAMDNTGLSDLLSHWLVSLLGGLGPLAVLAGIMISTSVLTMFISNTAAAILFAPIALHSASVMALSPYPFLMGVAVAATLCFASPFSTPPNAMVMSAGKYSFMDYVKIGLPLQIILLAVMLFTLPFIFPFEVK